MGEHELFCPADCTATLRSLVEETAESSFFNEHELNESNEFFCHTDVTDYTDIFWNQFLLITDISLLCSRTKVGFVLKNLASSLAEVLPNKINILSVRILPLFYSFNSRDSCSKRINEKLMAN